MRTLKAFSVAAVLAVALAACSSNNSSSSSTTSTTSGTTTTINQTAATTTITTNWQTFFNGKDTDQAAREALLQNVSKLRSTYVKNNANPLAAQTAAQVTTVTFPSASDCQNSVSTSQCAKVSYNLVNNATNAQLLAGQTGFAVYANGQWLVSENTFCALVALGGGQCPA